MKSSSIAVVVIALMLGLNEFEPWNTQGYAAAAEWVKENPHLRVVERTGKFVRASDRPPHINLLYPDMFNAVVPRDAVLQVETTGNRYCLLYSVLPTGATITYPVDKRLIEVPKFVDVKHVSYEVSPDKIESIYTTHVTCWLPYGLVFLAGIIACFLICRS